MSLDCETAEAAQNWTTWTRNWWQRRSGVWWRDFAGDLESNWCFSDFVCDTSAFTLSVPKGPLAERTLRLKFIILQLLINWILDVQANKFKFKLSRSYSRFSSRSLSGSGEVCDDKFQPGCWENATYVRDTSDRSTTHRANCESHQHISPKQKQKKQR